MSLQKKILLPALFAFLLASIYIVYDPGMIKSDASEYDRLADSILVGEYALDGIPSMLREPGYPAFRAILKFIGFSLTGILWTQAVMYLFTILLTGATLYKIDPKTWLWGAWGAAFSYGLAFYPSQHLSENLTAFILAIVGFLFFSVVTNPTKKNWFFLGLSCGTLLLTRYAFLVIPIACIISLSIILFRNGHSKKNILTGIMILILTTTLVVSPWMIRNYKQFGVFNVAGRLGAIIYPRAWKADKSWGSLIDSYASVLVGRGILFTVYPTNQSIFQEQWGDWWRNPEKIKLWGQTPTEIDQNRKKEAIKIITSDFDHFAKYTVWTGVDVLRLMALPNPVFPAKGSPIEGTYGPMAKDGNLSVIQITALSLAHIIQLIWFACITLSMIFGFKKYGWRFVPGIILLSFVSAHFVGDGTARHAISIHPWLLAGIFMTVFYPAWNYLRNSKHS